MGNRKYHESSTQRLPRGSDLHVFAGRDELGILAAVSRVGGNPYVIEDGVNGVLFPEKDGEAIARAILGCKNDESSIEPWRQTAPKYLNNALPAK